MRKPQSGRRSAAALAAIIAMAVSAVSCTTVQLTLAKAMNAVMPNKEKAESLDKATIKVVAASYSRPRPLSLEERDKIKIESLSSYVRASLYTADAHKYLEFDGAMDANGNPLVLQASNTYIAVDPKLAGEFKLTFAGKSGKKTVFSQAFAAEKLEVKKPAANAQLDLSKGFELEWTKGSDPAKFVRVLATVTSGMNYEQIAAFAVFPDTGSAAVTPEMLARFYKSGGNLWGPGVDGTYKLKAGANALVVERFSDEVRSEPAPGTLYEAISGDAVPVTFAGAPSPAAVAAKEYKRGKVAMTLDPDYRTAAAPSADLDPIGSIRSLALSSFTFGGMTAYHESTKTSDAIIATDYYWKVDQSGLDTITAAMGDLYASRVAAALGADEVPAETLKACPAYAAAFSPVANSIDNIKYTFLTSARGLGLDPEEGAKVIAAMPFRDLRGGKWLDLAAGTDVDLFIGGSFYISRNPQKAGEPKDESEFAVAVTFYGLAYPVDGLAQGFELPRATTSWTTDKFKLDSSVTVEKLIQILGFEDAVDCYAKALADLKAAK